MPSPAAPSSKRTPSAASTNRSRKKEAAEDDDAKPYVIVNEIGKGSFATVYKGYHEVRIVT
jgi:serine/threonine-protein kinase ULK2